ncbi:unnamed protein product [Coffea canephora]|uniref:Uncharacterized protein n=1 Tax=Coffea canephora TaxID=49390 RepID=A0A068VAS4_COFCA|nr:unnamed protein product [Coffea canephora]
MRFCMLFNCVAKKNGMKKELWTKGARNGLISVRGNKKDESKRFIVVNDVEKHMYAVVAPYPDIIIHTSSETWLSNFLFGKALIAFYMHLLYFGPRLVFGIWFGQFLDFQRNFSYLKEKTKQS